MQVDACHGRDGATSRATALGAAPSVAKDTSGIWQWLGRPILLRTPHGSRDCCIEGAVDVGAVRHGHGGVEGGLPGRQHMPCTKQLSVGCGDEEAARVRQTGIVRVGVLPPWLRAQGARERIERPR